jgi:membrane fusion protein (multidrug efflux system)
MNDENPKNNPATEEPRPKPSKNAGPGRRLIIAVVLVEVLAWVAYYFTSNDHAPKPQQGRGMAGPVSARIFTIEPQEVPYTSEFLAQTEASKTIQVRARVSGFLVEQGFKEEEVVEKDILDWQRLCPR